MRRSCLGERNVPQTKSTIIGFTLKETFDSLLHFHNIKQPEQSLLL